MMGGGGGGGKSSFFTISIGVGQGGILSPKLFSVCMDDLSNMLILSGIGCYIYNVCVNHVFYADDLCLMAPSKNINICHNCSIIVDLNFNAKNSFCFVFTPRLFKLSLPYSHINNIPIYQANQTSSGVERGSQDLTDVINSELLTKFMVLVFHTSNRLVRYPNLLINGRPIESFSHLTF